MTTKTPKLPESLHAAYEWIDSAGEWAEALAGGDEHVAAAHRNAVENDVDDVTASDLADVIEWVRRNKPAYVARKLARAAK